MSEKKLGQEAAFPIVETEYNGITQSYQHNCTDPGISKRFYTACAAMQGILSSGRVSTDSDSTWIAKRSYQIADELLKQENL